MTKEFFFNFQGRSKDTIEQSIREQTYTSTLKRLSRRTESGKKRLSETIASMLRGRSKNEQITRKRHLVAMVESQEITSELVDLIEKYAALNLGGELRQRLQRNRDEKEILEFEQGKHELHSQIRELAKNTGIPEEKILDLIEMRVQDRLAESRVDNISQEATDASGIPLQANDDDLVYATTYSEWRLLSPEERRDTYSLVYSCIFRPHDSAYYELAPDGRSPLDINNIVPKARVDYVIDFLKKIAEDLKSKHIEYSDTNSHYCHDDENYPRDDWMAFRHLTFFLKCPKEDIREVIRKLEIYSKREREDG